ncbi:MAG: DoxX family protein [Candidatus Omnitrophica bacterium]|nr:DoxX family protein [Candidatus Omnitrophota bacterium]
MKSDHRYTDLGLFLLRVFAGIGIAYHGYGKIFGGYMDKFILGVERMGFPMPEVFAWMAAASEFAGGILLAIGLFTRPAAFLIFSTMFVAFFIAHGDDPFSKKELAACYLVMSGCLMLTGGGAFSLKKERCKKKGVS